MINNLPFNASMVRDFFVPLYPDQIVNEENRYWIVLQQNSLVIAVSSEQDLFFGSCLPEWIVPESEPLMIGLWHGKPLYALRIKPLANLPVGYGTMPFQGTDTSLDNVLATISGRASQIMHWERRSRFCSHCGCQLFRIPASWGKRCSGCDEVHFPHIHPCIIVLVRRDDELLLIRNSSWSPGRYSLVAGFLDFGESLEECVKREVQEEAGIDITNIRYLGSQCWPFPSQQMIGFIADYAAGEVKPDGVEVVEADWFHKDALPVQPGSKRSISRWIIENYQKYVSLTETPK